MSIETKSRRHNVTAKASLKYISEVWILKTKHKGKLQSVHMRFLRPLSGLSRLDRKSNEDIHNKLKVSNLVEDISYNGCKLLRMESTLLSKMVFQYQPKGLTRSGKTEIRMDWSKTSFLKTTETGFYQLVGLDSPKPSCYGFTFNCI